MHDLLFENQDDLSGADLRDYAARIGLDRAGFRAAFESPGTLASIQNSVRSAKSLGLHGTPSLFVNGERHDNNEKLWEMERLLPLVEAAMPNS